MGPLSYRPKPGRSIMLFQVIVIPVTLLATSAVGQMQMPMHHDPVAEFLMQQASGTSHDPAAVSKPMLMMNFDKWMLMAHGNVFVNQVVETGPHGADRFFSTNWIMGMAQRPLAGGQLLLRSMLSLEPATIGTAGYPELFQTGEGLINRQHAHDFFMELAAEYAVEVAPGTIGYIYAAPVGDPALGPVGFPHRASAAEIPQAPLSHHLQDSTHIADGVMTIGARQGEFGLAVSGFHGAEPDNQNRWDIDEGRLDSWSIRGTWDPTPRWTAQISTGHLHHPEAADPLSVQRTTASAAYSDGNWSSSVIWGWNHKSDNDSNGLLAETVFRFNVSNYLSGRFEILKKEEFSGTIKALTAGYTKDIYRTGDLLGGVGGNATVYAAPDGTHPLAFYAFVRVRNESHQ